MDLFARAMRLFEPARKTRRRGGIARKRLGVEFLESRKLLTTVPFTIVNNTTINPAGTLAYQDSQITIAIYGQDFTPDDDYYYFDAQGNAHLTSSVPIPPNPDHVNPPPMPEVPTFQLTALQQTAPHTYVINLPEVLTGGQGIDSARVYISMNAPIDLTINPDGKGSVNGPAFGDSYWDFFEFTLNAATVPPDPPSNLNIDTTNVDQFGFPITIKLDSTDTTDNPPNGVGTATTRASVITQFQQFTADPGDDYAVLLDTSAGAFGSYRIMNPSDYLDEIQPAQNQIAVRTSLANAITSTSALQIQVEAGAETFPPISPSTPIFIQIDGEVMEVTQSASGPSNTFLWTVSRRKTALPGAPRGGRRRSLCITQPRSSFRPSPTATRRSRSTRRPPCPATRASTSPILRSPRS